MDKVGQLEVPTLFIAEQIQRFVHRNIDENQLYEYYREYADKLVTVEVAFTKAIIIVNEPTVQEQVDATAAADDNSSSLPALLPHVKMPAKSDSLTHPEMPA